MPGEITPELIELVVRIIAAVVDKEDRARELGLEGPVTAAIRACGKIATATRRADPPLGRTGV